VIVEGVLRTDINILDLPTPEKQLRRDEKKGPFETLNEANKRMKRRTSSKKEDFSFRPGFNLLLVFKRL
jgi:hypothetical protein